MDSKVPPHSVNTSNKGSYLFPYFPGLGNLLAVNRQNIARGVQIMQLQVTQFAPMVLFRLSALGLTLGDLGRR
jgi:hypothetical protein